MACIIYTNTFTVIVISLRHKFQIIKCRSHLSLPHIVNFTAYFRLYRRIKSISMTEKIYHLQKIIYSIKTFQTIYIIQNFEDLAIWHHM